MHVAIGPSESVLYVAVEIPKGACGRYLDSSPNGRFYILEGYLELVYLLGSGHVSYLEKVLSCWYDKIIPP